MISFAETPQRQKHPAVSGISGNCWDFQVIISVANFEAVYPPSPRKVSKRLCLPIPTSHTA